MFHEYDSKDKNTSITSSILYNQFPPGFLANMSCLPRYHHCGRTGHNYRETVPMVGVTVHKVVDTVHRGGAKLDRVKERPASSPQIATFMFSYL